MGDRAVGADPRARTEADMDHAEILHVAVRADLDRVVLGADHRVGPDRRSGPDRDLAEDADAGIDERRIDQRDVRPVMLHGDALRGARAPVPEAPHCGARVRSGII